MYVCIYIYICICVCVRVCISISLFTYINIYIDMGNINLYLYTTGIVVKVLASNPSTMGNSQEIMAVAHSWRNLPPYISQMSHGFHIVERSLGLHCSWKEGLNAIKVLSGGFLK